MMDGALGALDWSAPWLDGVRQHGRRVASAADARGALNDAAARLGLRNARRQPVRFVDATAAGDMPYEAYVGSTGQVPTRDNLHDLFNALVWLSFPRTKARLNALQAGALQSGGAGSRRGALRDAATLIDENGVLLATTRSDIVEALHARAWNELFVRKRGAWPKEVRPVVFGHALMEKLIRPYKAITGHTVVAPIDAGAADADLDAAIAAVLDAALTPRRLLPLPVLGIPGWADNDEPGYYDDATVFRLARTRGEPAAARHG